MENIVFCGGCGTFISATEISAGKASKINNIYYCQKCSTGTQAAPGRPAPAAPAQPRPVSARPAMPAAQPQIKRPQPAATVPAQSRPVSPAAKPAVPALGQRPPMARPPVQTGQIKPAVPPVRPATATASAKPVSLHQTQRVASSQPSKTSPAGRLKPGLGARGKLRPQAKIGDNEEGANTSGQPQGKAKGGLKKIYLIGGAVAAAVIAVFIFMSISSANKKKAEEDRLATLKKYYNEIVEAEREYQNEPQKIIEQIAKRADSLKGTRYEEKLKEMEAAAKALIIILDKMKELDIDVNKVKTAEEIEKRIKDINAFKSNPGVTKMMNAKLLGMLELLAKEQQRISEDEQKVRDAKEAAEKKMYDEFKTKIDALRTQKDWKAMLKECDILLGRASGLQYQEEVDRIKEEAKDAIKEQEAKAQRRKDWQTLSDDMTKWERKGDSKSEIYVDENSQIILKNTSSSNNRGAGTSITNNNEGEQWKDFTMEVEFKVLGGSFEMLLRSRVETINAGGFSFQASSGIPIPFPRKFGKEEWQKYTIELKGNKLTISGTGLTETKTTTVGEGAGEIGINVKGGDSIIIKDLKVKVIE